MDERYCRCPGCGECAAHAKEGSHKSKIKTLQARVEQLEKDAEVMRLLGTAEWKLTKTIPWDSLTDEANAKNAWMVERQQAPYCGPDGVRVWFGTTAHEAFEKAISAVKEKQ